MPDASGVSNVSQQTVREFLDEWDDIESEIGEVMAAAKEPQKRLRALKKRIEDAGISQRAFKRMREDAEIPATERMDDHRQYLMFMQYIGKPLLFQGEFAFDESDQVDIEEPIATDRGRQRVSDHGFTAGKAGKSNDINPWNPGTATFALWQENYTAGREEFLADQARIAGEMAPAAAPTRRGRPPGSKNKKKAGAANAAPDPAYEPGAEPAPEQEPDAPAPQGKPADDDRF